MIGAAALPTPTGASGHGTMWTSIATGASDSLFIARHRPTSLRGPLDQSFVRQARTPCPAVWSPLDWTAGITRSVWSLSQYFTLASQVYV
jgi:hypothetical protein